MGLYIKDTPRTVKTAAGKHPRRVFYIQIDFRATVTIGAPRECGEVKSHFFLDLGTDLERICQPHAYMYLACSLPNR